MQFHFLMVMGSGLNSGIALRGNHPWFHHPTWRLDTWVLGTQLLSHPCIRQTAEAGYIMQLTKCSNILFTCAMTHLQSFYVTDVYTRSLAPLSFPSPLHPSTFCWLPACHRNISLLFQPEMEQYLKWCHDLLLQNYSSDWGWPCYQGPYLGCGQWVIVLFHE